MARSLLFVLVACWALGVASISEAKQPKANTPTPAAKAQTKTIRGVISFVDLEAKTLKLEVKDKQQAASTLDMKTDDKTEFMLDGAAVTLADLRDGMKVTVTELADTGVAMRVTAKSEPKSKPAKS